MPAPFQSLFYGRRKRCNFSFRLAAVNAVRSALAEKKLGAIAQLVATTCTDMRRGSGVRIPLAPRMNNNVNDEREHAAYDFASRAGKMAARLGLSFNHLNQVAQMTHVKRSMSWICSRTHREIFTWVMPRLTHLAM